VGSLRASVWAMKAGALDFLEKPVDPAAFVERVRNALTLSREQARVEAERKVVEGRRLAEVTPRERQVLWLLVRGGLSNRQMAAELGTAVKTIKVHRGQVKRKMQSESSADMFRRRCCGRHDDPGSGAHCIVVPPIPPAASSATASHPSRYRRRHPRQVAGRSPANPSGTA
jgi:FixJ family two-component response regulator